MWKAGSVWAWGKSVVMSGGDQLWKLIHWRLYVGFLCWRTMAINIEQKTAARSGNCFMWLLHSHFNGPESLAIDWAELRYMRVQLWCTIKQSKIQIKSIYLLGIEYCIGNSISVPEIFIFMKCTIGYYAITIRAAQDRIIGCSPGVCVTVFQLLKWYSQSWLIFSQWY